MTPWLATLHTALREEEDHARAVHADLLALPLADRVEAGVCWADVRITDAQQEGRRWSAVARGELHEGIGPGDRIRLVPAGPNGRVVAVDVHGAELLLDAEPAEGRTHIEKLFDDATFRRYRIALERADEAGGPVVRALLDPTTDTPEEVLPPAWPGLDEAQARAATASLGRRVALIHGPPGTGKTHVLTALLAQAVEEGDRPWALADSNAAVDHLARTALAAGLDVLRLGVPHRVDPALAPATLEGWTRRSPYAGALDAIAREIAMARSRKEGGRTLGPLFDERRRLVELARGWVFGTATVIASTHGTLAARMLDGEAPPAPGLVVVDEATQALEPAIWVSAPKAQRLVLFGDPHQLGPVVTSRNPVLERSLLERLLDHMDAPMLEVQRRMHGDIHALVQDVYGAAWRPHASVADRTLGDLPPVELVDTAGSGSEERVDPRSLSRWNPEEVRLVGLALRRLLDAGVAPAAIAVATPYSAQVARIRALPEAAGVRVGSVNALQGQEADAVLLSFVRSNPDGEIGFLNDERRLTVGLTRARSHLWMCGDSATLGRHPRYAALLEACEALGALTSVWEPPWTE